MHIKVNNNKQEPCRRLLKFKELLGTVKILRKTFFTIQTFQVVTLAKEVMSALVYHIKRANLSFVMINNIKRTVC